MTTKAAYGTESEIKFIDGLGKFADTPLSRPELLEGYRDALQQRSEWGHINQVLIREYVEYAIELAGKFADVTGAVRVVTKSGLD